MSLLFQKLSYVAMHCITAISDLYSYDHLVSVRKMFHLVLSKSTDLSTSHVTLINRVTCNDRNKVVLSLGKTAQLTPCG